MALAVRFIRFEKASSLPLIASPIAVAASIVGTTMGVQGALGGKRLDEALIGLKVSFQMPWDRVAIGCGLVLLLSLIASAPAVIALGGRSPRELLAAMKGG